MRVLILMFSVILSSCLFTNDSFKEKKIAGNYYLSYNGDGYADIIKKQPDANTSSVVINSKVDSLAYVNGKIFGTTDSAYFTISVQDGSVYYGQKDISNMQEVKFVSAKDF